MARKGGGSRSSNPGTAVLKTPGKQATPVKGSGTGVVINAARASHGPVRRNPSGVPSVTRVKGQGAVSRTKNDGGDSARNK